MTVATSSATVGERFLKMHSPGRVLFLPNVWDVAGAALAEEIGFCAVATSSSAIALSQGFDDGQEIPFEQVLRTTNAICRAVSIPVSADIERGYARSDSEFESNIGAVLGSGVAGINLEDTDYAGEALLPVEEQCARIALARKIADDSGRRLFVNGRTDAKVQGGDVRALSEVYERLAAYCDAGADGVFPVRLIDAESIRRMCKLVDAPVNILVQAGCPPISQLEDLGVRRVSFGSGLFRWCLATLGEALRRIKGKEPLDSLGAGMPLAELRRIARRFGTATGTASGTDADEDADQGVT